MVFHAVTTDSGSGLASQFGQFLISVVIGSIGGLIGIGVLWLVLCKMCLGEALGTSAQLASLRSRPSATSFATTRASSRRS